MAAQIMVCLDAYEIHSENEAALVNIEGFLQENFPTDYPTSTLHDGGWMGFSIAINNLSGKQRDVLWAYVNNTPTLSLNKA